MSAGLDAQPVGGAADPQEEAAAPVTPVYPVRRRRWRPARDHVVPMLLPGSALLIAFVLRIADLGAVGLNSDEAVYAAQSASLAGNPHFVGLFPVVRAHPLLLQVLMSPWYADGVPDVPGRYLAALFGVGTVGLVYMLGRTLYDRRVGGLAALFLAVMPYHVAISRQIMLDGPMAFFATGSLLCLAVASTRPARARWLIAAGACLGLAALSKETAVILIGSAFVFLALVNHLWRPLRFPLAGAIVAVTIALAYPVLTAVAGGSHSGQSYLLWQLTREPNHSFGFYFDSVGRSMGPLLILVAAAGLIANRFTHLDFSWRETLLISWIGVPLLFFEVWPVKGFSYLTPLAPAVVVLAARALAAPAWLNAGRRVRAAVAAVVGLVVLAAAVPSVASIVAPNSSGLAGAGGLRGGREVGRWIATNVPLGARLMTIGPSMANLIQYYSGRRSDGLSVSPNPLHRNPSYHSIDNADLELRSGAYQYVVWDAYSAERSPVFAARANQLAARFHGRAVHVVRGELHGRAGQRLIVVYEVTP
jgi:hypothetical protein